jgi:hypothetical protein
VTGGLDPDGSISYDDKLTAVTSPNETTRGRLMSNLSRLVIGWMGIWASIGSAEAVTYPYKLHQEQNIDTHQVGWIDLTIDAQGHASLTDSWSNGKQTSGNTFYAIVVLVGKDGKVVYSDKQTKGLDGSGFGHAREGHVATSFTFSKEQLDEFDHVALKMGAMNVAWN